MMKVSKFSHYCVKYYFSSKDIVTIRRSISKLLLTHNTVCTRLIQNIDFQSGRFCEGAMHVLKDKQSAMYGDDEDNLGVKSA